MQRLYQRRLAESTLPTEADDLLRRQLLAALATITQRELRLYVEEQARGMVSRGVGRLLTRHANRLLDALKTGGFEGYRKEAKRQSGFSGLMRLAANLHRWTGLEGPLARRLAMRAELLLVRQHALQEAIDFAHTRIGALFGDRVAETAESVLKARVADLERSIDALRLQYPDYWEQVSGRYLSRVAVRLELEAYDRMLEERLLSPELFRTLASDLEARLHEFEAIPPVDLKLDVAELVAGVPLLRDLGPEAAREIADLTGAAPRPAGRAHRPRGRAWRRDVLHRFGRRRGRAAANEWVRLGTGDFFGEMALINRRPRGADVIAIAYCRLLVLSREPFRRFLRTHPELMRRVRAVAVERARALRPEGELVRGAGVNVSREAPAGGGDHRPLRTDRNGYMQVPVAPVAQSDRALASGARGQRFESLSGAPLLSRSSLAAVPARDAVGMRVARPGGLDHTRRSLAVGRTSRAKAQLACGHRPTVLVRSLAPKEHHPHRAGRLAVGGAGDSSSGAAPCDN